MYLDAQTAIETLCQSRWQSATVVFDRLASPPLKAPMDFENLALENADSFQIVLRPRIVFQGSDNIGLGASCKRYKGRLALCIFHKPGSGLVEALLLADDACKYFDNKRFGIYEFFVGEVRKLPGVTQGWVQTIASFPFEFDIRS